ncbi:MAG: RNA polymerase III C11 subunit [Vezdaea acicularis]|nr:MAG: RNA polymerase III C11 subunit [Vezdaea acicularis]
MLVFCPACSNALTVTSTEEVPPQNRLECRTCPYQFIIDKRYYERRYFPRKEDDDVLGGEGSWDNVDKQDDVPCPSESCSNREAYFYQVQIRSADEPMTTFYRVCDL